MSIGTLVRTWRQGLAFWRYRRLVARALALNLRGEVRRDGLQVMNASSRLDIQWRARQIHPWDRGLPREVTEPLFIEQCLADTEAAISRLFIALPEIDTIALTVLDPASNRPILAGTVHRGNLEDVRIFASIKMRLRELGVDYRLTQSEFVPLDSNDSVGLSVRME